MEKMKTAYSADFYAEKGFLDEKNSCVRVPVGKENNLKMDDIVLIENKIDSKYSHLKFTGRNKEDKENGTIMFFYE